MLEYWRGFGGGGGAGFRIELVRDGEDEMRSPDSERNACGLEGRGGNDLIEIVDIFLSVSSISGSVNERWTPGNGSSSKSISVPMIGPFSSLLKVLADRLSCLGGSGGGFSSSFVERLIGEMLLLSLLRPRKGDREPRGPIAESKKLGGLVVVTSRMKTPRIRPGFASITSVYSSRSASPLSPTKMKYLSGKSDNILSRVPLLRSATGSKIPCSMPLYCFR